MHHLEIRQLQHITGLMWSVKSCTLVISSIKYLQGNTSKVFMLPIFHLISLSFLCSDKELGHGMISSKLFTLATLKFA